MLRKFLALQLLISLFVLSLFAETQNAILISWDGALREDLQALMAAGKAPVVSNLKETGAFVEIQVVGHATATGPGHAQMLTGLKSEDNKVISNGDYYPIPEGWTIGERLETALGKNKIFTIMVMGKAGSYMKATEGTPYFNAKKNIDVWDGDKDRDATTVNKAGLKYIEKYKNDRFFLFMHFRDPDSYGHSFGENSPEYEKAIITCDELVGKVIAKLKELNLYEKTMVYVTADHGFDKGKKNHSNAPDIFLATNDKTVIYNGTQADITPTILNQFGIDGSKLVPPLAGKPLNK